MNSQTSKQKVTFLRKESSHEFDHPVSTAKLSHTVDHYGSIVIVTAHITSTSVTFTRMTSHAEPKQFTLTEAELDTLLAAREQFHAHIEAEKQAEEERLHNLKKQAYELARSLKFELESLNIHIKQQGEYYTVALPAIGFEQTVHEYKLLDTVQEALDKLEHNVTFAEKHYLQINEWNEICSAYRKVKPKYPELPIQAEQGESLPTSEDILQPGDLTDEMAERLNKVAEQITIDTDISTII